MPPPSAFPLATAAIVLGAIAVGACFLTWAVPRRPAGDIAADLQRGLEGPERPADAPRLIAGLREAYAQSGTSKPFHGVWVAILAGLGAVVTMVAASLEHESRRQYGETTLRVAGVIFALAFLAVLIDCSSGMFQRKDRGVGLWIALAATLTAALAATFASARAGGSDERSESVEQDG